MAKYNERLRARELRSKGESIGNIAKLVNSSKGSVSVWCNDIFISKIQRDKLTLRSKEGRNKGRLIANENKKIERLDRLEKHKTIGKNKIGLMSERELFLIGAALYWAEGGKTQRITTFINSDPKMVLILIKWLKDCLNVSIDRLICRIEINEIHRDRLSIIEKYWSNLTKIPISQFTKPSLKHSKISKIYSNNDNYFGSLQIKVKKGTNLNYEILGYIEGLGSAEMMK